jgi:hypothetical protein
MSENSQLPRQDPLSTPLLLNDPGSDPTAGTKAQFRLVACCRSHREKLPAWQGRHHALGLSVDLRRFSSNCVISKRKVQQQRKERKQ